jgi:outer membrane protein assembly factor BamB
MRLDPEAPWPCFRRDQHNTGRSSKPGVYLGGAPWHFQTGKGIFSTAVIGPEEAVYAGSADHFFYALNPNGKLKWKLKTGDIIDSAAALTQDEASQARFLSFASGDGFLYHLRLTGDGYREEWKFEAEARPGISYNRWFEGNVAVSPSGDLYAGNTNFNYYAINSTGRAKWAYSTGSNNWSQAAFANDGTIFWGSCDTFIHAVSSQGGQLWRKRTLGFISASAAVGSDGMVYIGSFDSNLYALDPKNGRTRWKFRTGDHIYASVGLGCDQQGNTTAIYLASTDGFVYALGPSGRLLWKFASLAPVRSSPAVGLSPEGDEIVYFGCGDGCLYALNAIDGSLRWAYDTTPADTELTDRNDLNASPALGRNGIYIGGEHGSLWHIPYDYPLHNPEDRRSRLSSAGRVADGARLFFVTPGGNTRDQFPAEILPAAQIALRLVVYENGKPVDARLWNNPLYRPADYLDVLVEPPVELQTEISADGRFLYLRPQGFLSPGHEYRLKISGSCYQGGLRLGNLALLVNPRPSTRFQEEFHFRVPASPAATFPLLESSESLPALEWTRLAAPLPTMLPSLNQIGFDHMDWIMIPVASSPTGPDEQGKMVIWATGAQRDENMRPLPDPGSEFTLVFNGRCQGSDFILTARNFNLAITGIRIPFNLFELRGRLGEDGITRSPAAWADTQALSIPTFGPYLVIAGLANNWLQKLLVYGTFITRAYRAAVKPSPSLSVAAIRCQLPSRQAPGWVEATFSPGSVLLASCHRAGLVLVDEQRMEAVPLDYHASLSTVSDEAGLVRSVRLALPQGMKLPETTIAYVIVDAAVVRKDKIG